MSYTTVEDALVTTLETLSGMTGKVTRGDHGILNRGKPPKAIVLEYLGFERMPDAFHDVETAWRIDLLTYMRFIKQSSLRADLATFRQAIIDKIDTFPHLGGTTGVFDAFIGAGERGNRTQDEFVVVGSIKYYAEHLICTVREDASVSYTG